MKVTYVYSGMTFSELDGKEVSIVDLAERAGLKDARMVRNRVNARHGRLRGEKPPYRTICDRDLLENQSEGSLERPWLSPNDRRTTVGKYGFSVSSPLGVSHSNGSFSARLV
jgi:hypothetical protein